MFYSFGWCEENGINFEYALAPLFILTVSFFELTAFLPFAYIETFSVKHAFGFSKVTTSEFFIGRYLPLVEVLALYTPVTLLTTFVIQISGKDLILVIAVGTFIVELVLNWVYPRLILPLTQTQTKLPDDHPLKPKILALARSVGFTNENFFFAESTGDDLHSNAFVNSAGIGLSPSLLEHHKDHDDEILAIIAHELGHW